MKKIIYSNLFSNIMLVIAVIMVVFLVYNITGQSRYTTDVVEEIKVGFEEETGKDIEKTVKENYEILGGFWDSLLKIKNGEYRIELSIYTEDDVTKYEIITKEDKIISKAKVNEFKKRE